MTDDDETLSPELAELREFIVGLMALLDRLKADVAKGYVLTADDRAALKTLELVLRRERAIGLFLLADSEADAVRAVLGPQPTPTLRS